VRRAVALALVVSAVTAVGWLVVGSTGSRDDAAASTSSASPSSTSPASAGLVDRGHAGPATPADWRVVVDRLYQRRAQAFRAASPELLDRVYAEGSPLLTADAGFVSSLADAGERLRGYVPTVERVTSAQADGDHVGLDLVDSWAAAEVVAGEVVVRGVPERPASAVHMVLVRSGDSWLIESAERWG
jgi:hypothetical protein